MERGWGYGSEQQHRNENLDCYGVFDFGERVLAIVCDGMGGQLGGAQAATLCLRTVHDFVRANPKIPARDLLRGALEEANQVIYEAARKNHRLLGMGTTAVVAILDQNMLTIAHVGDSRAYLIRAGQQALALTRDHTMVNLFVDAELLTPEDAATHPEAHVLSRSLGVERAVEVEIGPALSLNDGDAVLLCSDGLHGKIADFELGEVEWTSPQAAVRELLDVALARHADDNATAVAVRFGLPLGDSPPPTQLPELPSGDAVTGRTTGHDREDDEPNPTPIAPTPEAGQPNYVVFDERPDDIRDKVRKDIPMTAPKPGRGRYLLFGALGAGVFFGLCGIVMITVLSRYFAQDEIVASEPDDGGEIPNVEAVEVEAAARPPQSTSSWWAAELPKAPPRAPWRPSEWGTSPPRSPEQIKAVTAARARQCAASLNAVRDGMAYSTDHALLYTTAWTCFDEDDQRALRTTRIGAPDELSKLRPYLEGEIVGPLPAAAEKPEAAAPPWARPALDGIESRLYSFDNSSEKDHFAEVIQARIGRESVADSLAIDLLIEAQLARQLSKVEVPSPEVITAWARRVFVVSSALRATSGELVSSYRPEVRKSIDALLSEATTPPTNPDGTPGALPAEVAAALAAGTTGVLVPVVEKPAPKKGGAPAPKRPQEPTLEELQRGAG